LTRADLPEEFTPETVRSLGFRAVRQLAKHGNGILTDEEQQQFDGVWRSVIADTSSRVEAALERAQRSGHDHSDPELRRSYARTQRRLEEQARRTREAFPQLDWPTEPPAVLVRAPDATTAGTDHADDTDDTGDDVSVERLTEEIEETATTLELLDRIATIQQQQLEHQESQRLLDTRGLFFAFVVSVAVIIAGVAPLVEAEPHDRMLIAVWTLGVCVLAGVVYALVRAVQRRSERPVR
jgi:hypothetical protein